MILGILGGMGPLATCEFFKKIIELTPAEKDQDHLHIIIDNNTNIPDRTEYILGKGKDPRIELIRSAIRLESMGVDYIAIPCNTAHYFYDDIVKYTKVKILNMIYETVNFLKANNSGNKDYLLLATEGTYQAKIYDKAFNSSGLNILTPNDKDKKIIMKWIYGIKSSNFNVTLKEFESLINKYMTNKEIPIIVGCTELSFLFEKIKTSKQYFDPLTILAKCCIDLAIK
ncbi:aspartate racemase [Keratinibaculum paraultunense]|uniref:Aspartate racemase n=1 Tax=Keratinibaculum paraultunense TaxID=1278232 RepID=A0A4R3L0I1_9FIRM|nr:amino acid racemase [Keratinibaculum paraultunense]QQY79983.1 aspartate/glutamate racemase family protein [Keratinibaculum paraultunense]TCS91695.1 aspartate racemase [Keratinibaculum paraultunense]